MAVRAGNRPVWFALIGLLASSCGLVGTDALPGDADPLSVGAALSLTGSLSQDGQLVKEGYLFCQEWLNNHGGVALNGHPYRLDIRMMDDESRVSLSAGDLEQLISQNHVKLLLGPSANSTTARDAAIAEQHQLPMVQSDGPSAAIFNNHYRYVFGVGAPARRQMEGVIDMALNQDVKPQSVAILAANDTLSTELGGEMRDYATSRGLSVVYFGAYPSGTNDVRSQLAGAAAANPDLLLEAGHSDESVLTMQQAGQLNVPARLIAFTQEPTGADFVKPLGKIANYAVGTTQWSPLAKVPTTDFLTGQDYANQYLSRFGHAPDQHSAGATAACLTLAAAAHQAGSADPAKVRDALTRVDLHTFFGEIRFDDQGANPSKAVYVEQVQSGKPVVVWPPEAAGALPRYPIPAWDKR
ncbi:MAG: hypothetical protein E6H92_13000 [Chloroflexi bacterium]|nr:MAG: hypothetical protein E6H92_13000 [Chloroflexota bacterium]